MTVYQLRMALLIALVVLASVIGGYVTVIVAQIAWDRVGPEVIEWFSALTFGIDRFLGVVI
jgi:hypothetical protein